MQTQVHTWLTRKDEIAAARRALDEEESAINGKLDNLRAILGDGPSEDVSQDDVQVDTEPQPEETVPAESFPEAVIGAVKAFRGNPAPYEIRSWLCENGATAAIREQAAKPYFYAALKRHVTNGTLVKIDGGYGVPPRRRRRPPPPEFQDEMGATDD
jgi:hypothetical protein